MQLYPNAWKMGSSEILRMRSVHGETSGFGKSRIDSVIALTARALLESGTQATKSRRVSWR
jgi:hypothetical protein